MSNAGFRVHVLAKTEVQPAAFKHLGVNGLAWLNAHRCYSEAASIVETPPSYLPETETEAGELLKGNILKPGHFGVLEGFNMSFEVVNFPHSVIVQHRTHRLAEFNVQSQRYTGERVLDLVSDFRALDIGPVDGLEGWWMPETASELKWFADLESVFYSRPCGEYRDRDGKKFTIDQDTRVSDLLSDFRTAEVYSHRMLRLGYSEETARDRLAQSVRQGYTFSCNIRSLMHFLDLRSPKNAQWEIRELAELLFQELKKTSPEIAAWYEQSRYQKNKISP